MKNNNYERNYCGSLITICRKSKNRTGRSRWVRENGDLGCEFNVEIKALHRGGQDHKKGEEYVGDEA